MPWNAGLRISSFDVDGTLRSIAKSVPQQQGQQTNPQGQTLAHLNNSKTSMAVAIPLLSSSPQEHYHLHHLHGNNSSSTNGLANIETGGNDQLMFDLDGIDDPPLFTPVATTSKSNPGAIGFDKLKNLPFSITTNEVANNSSRSNSVSNSATFSGNSSSTAPWFASKVPWRSNGSDGISSALVAALNEINNSNNNINYINLNSNSSNSAHSSNSLEGHVANEKPTSTNADAPLSSFSNSTIGSIKKSASIAITTSRRRSSGLMSSAGGIGHRRGDTEPNSRLLDICAQFSCSPPALSSVGLFSSPTSASFFNGPGSLNSSSSPTKFIMTTAGHLSVVNKSNDPGFSNFEPASSLANISTNSLDGSIAEFIKVSIATKSVSSSATSSATPNDISSPMETTAGRRNFPRRPPEVQQEIPLCSSFTELVESEQDIFETILSEIRPKNILSSVNGVATSTIGSKLPASSSSHRKSLTTLSSVMFAPDSESTSQKSPASKSRKAAIMATVATASEDNEDSETSRQENNSEKSNEHPEHAENENNDQETDSNEETVGEEEIESKQGLEKEDQIENTGLDSVCGKEIECSKQTRDDDNEEEKGFLEIADVQNDESASIKQNDYQQIDTVASVTVATETSIPLPSLPRVDQDLNIISQALANNESPLSGLSSSSSTSRRIPAATLLDELNNTSALISAILNEESAPASTDSSNGRRRSRSSTVSTFSNRQTTQGEPSAALMTPAPAAPACVATAINSAVNSDGKRARSVSAAARMSTTAATLELERLLGDIHGVLNGSAN